MQGMALGYVVYIRDQQIMAYQPDITSVIFENKVLLEHSHTLPFTYGLWLLSYDSGRIK